MSVTTTGRYATNTGRRLHAEPLVSEHGTPRVRLRARNAQGRPLPGVSETMSAEGAEAYALEILAAVTLARAAVADARTAAREAVGG